MYNINTFDEYNLKGADELTPCEYCNCRILIEGLYGWGVGYYSNKKYYDFTHEVYDKLKQAGYDIELSDSDSSCDYLIKESTNLRLYMHPMEFTGAATPDQINHITEILDSCDCISKTALQKATPLYELSDDEYRNLIYDDAENIAYTMLASRYDIKKNYDAGFDYAKKIRLDRRSDPDVGGLSSSDVDVAAVEDIRAFCLEQLNNGLDNKEIARKAGLKAQEWKEEIAFYRKAFSDKTKNMTLNEKIDFYMGEGQSERIKDKFLESSLNIHLKYITSLRDFRRIADENCIDYSPCKEQIER